MSASWATSSRRRPGVRRRPAAGNPTSAGWSRARRARRNSAASAARLGLATRPASGRLRVHGDTPVTSIILVWFTRRAAPRLGAMSATTQIETDWLQIPVPGASAPMQAYLARPAGPGPWPAVLLGFEMFGVTGYLREVAARVAADGYLALVPDFYHWQSADGSHTELPADADGRARGLDLINGLRREQVEADVRAAIEHLSARPDAAGQTAMVGLSAGGHIAYYAATRVPLAAVAVFYPGWLTGSEVGLSRSSPARRGSPRSAPPCWSWPAPVITCTHPVTWTPSRPRWPARASPTRSWSTPIRRTASPVSSATRTARRPPPTRGTGPCGCSPETSHPETFPLRNNRAAMLLS